MGSIQGAINNILGSAAVATATVSKVKKATDAEVEAIKQKELDEKNAEAQSIADTEAKLKEANQMALGYTKKELTKREAGETLGLDLPNKMPRGVSRATFERRMGNLKAMEEIQAKYVQNKEFRERLEKYSSKELSEAIKSKITKKGKEGKM